MTEKAQEKKGNMLPFNEYLISKEDKFYITGRKKLKDKICKATKYISYQRKQSCIKLPNRQSIEINNNPLLLTTRTAAGKSRKEFAENTCHNHWQTNLMCCVSHP